jgi:hypothetical protein
MPNCGVKMYTIFIFKMKPFEFLTALNSIVWVLKMDDVDILLVVNAPPISICGKHCMQLGTQMV